MIHLLLTYTFIAYDTLIINIHLLTYIYLLSRQAGGAPNERAAAVLLIEQLPNHRQRNLTSFEEHIQKHASTCFIAV